MHLILVADYFQQTRELRKGRVACKYGIEITNQENVTNVPNHLLAMQYMWG